MSEKITKEISKQKLAIIIAVVLISSIWGGVMYLEYKIAQGKKHSSVVKLEEGLCVFVPSECHALKASDHYGLYCQSGTSGKLYLDGRKPTTAGARQGTKQLEIKGKNKNYLLEINIFEDNNKNLGEPISCSQFLN